MTKPKKKLTTKQYVVAIAQVAKTTYRAAPLAIVVQVAGAVITSVLPIVTTYFAALTTTALAEAYAGDETAGERAILFVIITAVLGVVVMAWQSLETYIAALMRYRVEAAMTDDMYAHFLSLDFWRYDDKATADMYDRAQRFANFFPYIFDRLTRLLTSMITLIVGLGALILVNWWLGLIVIVAVIPAIIIQFSLSRASAKHWNDNVETRRSKNMIEWNMFQPECIAELRLYNIARHLLSLRASLRDKDEKQRIEFERSYIPRRLAADVLQAVAEVAALIWVTIQIIHRQQPIGQFLYVQQIVSRALGGAEQFVREMSQIDEDLANLFDYQEFMKLPDRQGGGGSFKKMPQQITLQDVSFHYPTSKKLVLKDVNITIRKDQHIAIVGENGAGKSTLIKILTGLYAPTTGRVLLDDTSLDTVTIETWHKQLGVLQQGYLSYGFATAKDNIYFGDVSQPFDQERFDSALERAEARTFLEKLPKGVDSYVSNWMEHDDGTKGADLSGGQWQRLALARNFYRDSPIIILDEPTSAIDALAEARIFKHLFADKKRTVITISHRLTTVEKADMIYMLQEGRVVEQGTHSDLVAKRGAYYTMFKSQLREK